MMDSRHLVIALIALPLLSFFGWWAAGALVGEQPRPVEQGKAYPLVAQSGCRYAGGLCALQNVDVTLALDYLEGSVEVRSSVPLDGVLAAIGPPSDILAPLAMSPADDAGLVWRLVLPGRPGRADHIRLAVHQQGVIWYGETGFAFL
ncbi:MAG: hypothetical protein HRT77_15095 [Halioglobus sp.]|nr:hypothetical protein [Halioglobus sp.]